VGKRKGSRRPVLLAHPEQLIVVRRRSHHQRIVGCRVLGEPGKPVIVLGDAQLPFMALVLSLSVCLGRTFAVHGSVWKARAIPPPTRLESTAGSGACPESR
jgi:hypothetical protein